MQDTIARLKTIGFTHAGCWKLSQGGIVFELNDLATARNVLYAIAVDGVLMYIGKTTIPLQDRMHTPKRFSAAAHFIVPGSSLASVLAVLR